MVHRWFFTNPCCYGKCESKRNLYNAIRHCKKKRNYQPTNQPTTKHAVEAQEGASDSAWGNLRGSRGDAGALSSSQVETARKGVLGRRNSLCTRRDVEYACELQAAHPGWGVSSNECAAPDGEGLNETGKGGCILS